MTKKIIGICGSPRKGNSEFLLQTVLEEASERGAETKLVLVREKNIALCDGCLTCAGGKAPCKIQNDDMKDIYQKIKGANIIILASPIWYDMVTPHTVNFIDRLNPVQSDLKGKSFAFILVGQLTGEEAEESQGRAISYLKQIAKLYEMNLIDFVLAKGVKDKGDAKSREDIIKKCRELGEKLSKLCRK
jgi:multimeric flavodoxin WrbA